MFACSYVDDVVDYPPAKGGHQLYSTVEKKRLPSHDDDSTSGYPDIISTTQVCWQFVASFNLLDVPVLYLCLTQKKVAARILKKCLNESIIKSPEKRYSNIVKSVAVIHSLHFSVYCWSWAYYCEFVWNKWKR